MSPAFASRSVVIPSMVLSPDLNVFVSGLSVLVVLFFLVLLCRRRTARGRDFGLGLFWNSPIVCPVLVDVFFCFRRLSYHRVLSKGVVGTVLFVFCRRMVGRGVGGPFSVRQGVRGAVRVSRFAECEQCNASVLWSKGQLRFVELPLRRYVGCVRIYEGWRDAVVRRAIFVGALHATQCFLSVRVGPRALVHVNHSSRHFRGAGGALRVIFGRKLQYHFCGDGVGVSLVVMGYAASQGPADRAGTLLCPMVLVRLNAGELVLTRSRKEFQLPGCGVVPLYLLWGVLLRYRVRVGVHATIVCTGRCTGDIS